MCFAALVTGHHRAAAQLPAELLPDMRPSQLQLNVCKDTPLGVVQPGGDITEALQWACDHAHEFQQPIVIPAGEFLISDTITTPYRAGFTLLGSGASHGIEHPRLRGVYTHLRWAGDEGGVMIRHQAGFARVGNFLLDGRGKAAIGLLVSGAAKGLGTSKTIFEPIVGEGFDHLVQIGKTQNTPNCDNMQFRWLEGKECKSSVLHMVNKMGMDIVVNHLRNYNPGSEQVGLLVDGGGQLWVQSSLTTSPGTLVKFNKDAGVGSHNGFYRFSQTKVDAQARDGFTLVDSDCPNQIRLLFDGGINSSDGMRIKLLGSNFLHLTDFSSHYTSITGKTHRGWGTPAVLVEACRCWDNPAEKITGNVNLRMRDCTDWRSQWLDDFDSQAASKPAGQASDP
ncbi:hypothetical protein NG895_04720 [Aeoliella sp. ICT_H6.2]|uniref:Pectate lyase superfamily protein domain-containing protein n=1 Tax=Aeoliella straminimaris TaxID=2954799 RepID=A0A9X2F6M0_9BACT|nr:hypothetical protein [Aeoliella straminimaris]MCO6043200.1 hypothetical protein [Aeoliella straminimaris]